MWLLQLDFGWSWCFLRSVIEMAVPCELLFGERSEVFIVIIVSWQITAGLNFLQFWLVCCQPFVYNFPFPLWRLPCRDFLTSRFCWVLNQCAVWRCLLICVCSLSGWSRLLQNQIREKIQVQNQVSDCVLLMTRCNMGRCSTSRMTRDIIKTHKLFCLESFDLDRDKLHLHSDVWGLAEKEKLDHSSIKFGGGDLLVHCSQCFSLTLMFIHCRIFSSHRALCTM